MEFKKKTDIYYHAYQIEYHYSDVQIKAFKNRIGRLEFRLDRLQKQLKFLRSNTKGVVFDSKKLFKGQHTLTHYRNNHKQWLVDWEQSRYSKMTISGRKDEKYGHFVFPLWARKC